MIVDVPPEAASTPAPPRRWFEFEIWWYVASAALSSAAVVIMTRLWNASMTLSPFNYSGDSISSAMYFKTVLQTGWYETQPDLGCPTGSTCTISRSPTSCNRS